MDMFSVFQVEQTYGMQVFNATMYCLIASMFWSSHIINYNVPATKQKNILLALLFLIFAVTPTYTGDFWGYKSLIEFFDPRNGTRHIEEVYNDLLRLIGPNYMLFRIIVWGGAEILFIWTCSRLDINPYKALFLLFCLFVTKFVYARVTLGMAVYFFGVSFLCKPIGNNRIISYIIGISIVLLSSVFHRSMIVPIIFTTMLFWSMTKKSVKFVFLIIPLLTIVLRTVLEEFAFLLDEEDYVYNIQNYSNEKDFGDTARQTNLLFWWQCLPFLFSFFYVTYLVIKNKSKFFISYSSILLYRITFGLSVFSYCCFFVRPENPTLFYRFMYMTMIPLIILISEMREKGIINCRALRIIALIGMSPEMATFLFRVFVKFTPIGYH